MSDFNSINHNERGNPHPQYDSQKLYYTKQNTDSNEKWVKIFDNNFQKDVNSFDLRSRRFNRLVFSTYVYSMDNDNKQNMCMLNFYAMVIASTGNLVVEVDGRNLLGNPNARFIVAYKDITGSDGKKEYNVRVYARLQYAYERIKLQLLIFDPVSNFNTPFNLECAKSGVNTYERCEAQFGNLFNNPLLTTEELNAELNGYTQQVCDLSYNYMKAKTLNLDSNEPKVTFTYSGTEKGFCKYDGSKDGIYFYGSNGTSKYVTNMNMLPSKTDTTVGSSSSPWNAGYFNAIGLKVYTSINDIPSGSSLAILNIPTYRGLAYKWGNYWYTASDNSVING